MKFEINKSVLIKLLIISALLIVAPYAVPFSIEFVLMADVLGLEALILFLIFQSRHIITPILVKASAWKDHIGATALLLAGLYFMQPDTFLIHAIGSSVLLLFTCSIALALAIWLPSFYLSHMSTGNKGDTHSLTT